MDYKPYTTAAGIGLCHQASKSNTHNELEFSNKVDAQFLKPIPESSWFQCTKFTNALILPPKTTSKRLQRELHNYT